MRWIDDHLLRDLQKLTLQIGQNMSQMVSEELPHSLSPSVSTTFACCLGEGGSISMNWPHDIISHQTQESKGGGQMTRTF